MAKEAYLYSKRGLFTLAFRSSGQGISRRSRYLRQRVGRDKQSSDSRNVLYFFYFLFFYTAAQGKVLVGVPGTFGSAWDEANNPATAVTFFVDLLLADILPGTDSQKCSL
jgi:hypothetical protein